MRITLRGFITHKEAEKYADCADNYAYSITNHRFAISDGVTKSFFPTIWSRILVDKFVTLQGATDLSIEDCQSEWLQQVTKIATSPDTMWFTNNAFIQRKSGLATLVTLRFDKNMWYAKALGDSFLFFVPKGKNNFKGWVYLSSRYISSNPAPIVFDSYPDYYSSREEKNGIEKEINGKLEAGRFYLMTDALSEWLINGKERALKEIETWVNQNVFEQKITDLRKKGLLNNDDSSILIIDIEKDGKQEFTYRSVNVQNIDNLLENKRKNEVKKEKMDTNNEQILQKIEKSSIAIHKKINRSILVNVVLFLIISGLVYIFSVNNKAPKQNFSPEEIVENQEQDYILTERNYSEPEKELSDSIEKMLNDSMDIWNKQSTIQQNEMNSKESDSINSK